MHRDRNSQCSTGLTALATPDGTGRLEGNNARWGPTGVSPQRLPVRLEEGVWGAAKC